MSYFKALTLVQRIGLGALIFIFILLYTALFSLGVHDPLDGRLYYSAQEAFRFLSSLSPEESQAYLNFEWLDLGFLTCYTCLSFLILRAIFNENKKIWFLAFIPGSFDLLENIRIISALCFGASEASLSGLGTLTLLKFTSLAAIICLDIFGIFKRCRRPARS